MNVADMRVYADGIDLCVAEHTSRLHAVGVSVPIHAIKLEFKDGIALTARDIRHMSRPQLQMLAESMRNGRSLVKTIILQVVGDSDEYSPDDLSEISFDCIDAVRIEKVWPLGFRISFSLWVNDIRFSALVEFDMFEKTIVVAGDNYIDEVKTKCAYLISRSIKTPMQILSEYINTARIRTRSSVVSGHVTNAL